MLSAAALPLLAFTVAAAVLTVTPGVDTAIVLRSSMMRGPKAGVAAGLGICAGLLFWGAATALGLTALLAASTLAFTLLKGLGAVYLLVMGLRLIAKPRAALNATGPAGSASQGLGDARDALRRGFLTNLLNPKVGVFYVTFVPQFVPQGVNVTAFSLLLAGVHVLLTSAWFMVLIALTVPLGEFLKRAGVIKTLDRLTGCVLVAFGVRLAIAQRA